MNLKRFKILLLAAALLLGVGDAVSAPTVRAKLDSANLLMGKMKIGRAHV